MKKNPLLKFIIAAQDDASKKALEADRRVDSLTAEKISKLYNLDVNTKGKRNIVEEAHPETVVAFDSYDKLNGVLKNDNQKQDITINILNRKQTGFLVHEKLASQSALINSLVKTANYLDSRDPALAMYCDKILVEFNNSLEKEAMLPPAVLAGILIPAGIVGLMYWQQHSSSANLGLLENIKRMGNEIDDILNDKAFITGRDYNQEFKNKLTSCKNNLSNILVLYKDLKDKIVGFTFPENGQELMALSKDLSSQDLITKFNEFKRMATAMVSYLTNLKEKLADDDMKAMQVSNKGFLTGLIDRAKILSGGSGLIKDDIDDLLALIDPVVASLLKTLEIMKKSQEKSQEVLRIGTSSLEPSTKKEVKAPEEDKETKRSMEQLAEQIKSQK